MAYLCRKGEREMTYTEIAAHIPVPEDIFDLYIRLLAIVKDESSDAYKQVNALTTLRASVVDVTRMLEQEIAHRVTGDMEA